MLLANAASSATNPIAVLIRLYHEWVPGFTDNVLWGMHTFVILLGVGVLFSVWTKFVQWRSLTHGLKVIRGAYDNADDPGAINHFQALSAALSATVGLGNIGGVAIAISIGGPGAVFWMWVVGLLGMSIKSIEVTLSMLYRDTSDPDNPHGGPMWVVTRGWGDKVGGPTKALAWTIGAIFCCTLLVSTMTGGNMFQAFNVGNITNEYFGVHPVISGIVLATLCGLVIVGGIRRIGAVAGRLVPLMCALYMLAGLVVLALNVDSLPSIFAMIVRDAFTPTEAAGAFVGATAWFGLTTGLRRALFSNEAGQGSSPIAHSAAKTSEPVREGVVAGLEPFIDTCVVCTLTALVILSTGAWNRAPSGPHSGDLRLAIVEPASDGADADGRHAIIVGGASLTDLPPLPAPDSWEEGNRLFLLAEAPEKDAKTGTRRVRVPGRIVRAATEGANHSIGDLIVWWGDDDAKVDPELTLVSTEIYRDFIGAALTGHAFDLAIPGLGKYLVTLACWLFALSTMISWSYYGEQGIIFLLGERAVLPYKLVFCLLAIVATVPAFISNDSELGLLADLGTGVMLMANVPIMLIMAPRAISALRDYFRRLDDGTMLPPHEYPKITDVVEGRDVEKPWR